MQHAQPQALKRIQSRVLIQELTPEELELVAGAGCKTTGGGGCSGGSNGSSCSGNVDYECTF